MEINGPDRIEQASARRIGNQVASGDDAFKVADGAEPPRADGGGPRAHRYC